MLATASLELKAEKQSAHSNGVTSVAFSPDGSTIVSGSDDKTIKVWDAGVPNPKQMNVQQKLTTITSPAHSDSGSQGGE